VNRRLILRKNCVEYVLDGFDGKLTTSRWAKIAKCSQDTALRDILPLVRAGILVRNREGGRSTSYSVGKIEEGGAGKKNEKTQVF
jgi:Fic family protein